MTKYEFKLQLTTDLDPKVIHKTISSMAKSGKVEIHWIRAQEIKDPGRPNEIKAEIMGYIETVDYPRSARQMASALKRTQTSLYKSLHELVREGMLAEVEDKRWRVKRYGDEYQVAKFNEREERHRLENETGEELGA